MGFADYDHLDTYVESLLDDPVYEAWANNIEDIDAFLDAAYEEAVVANAELADALAGDA